jgi:hypothetical protein
MHDETRRACAHAASLGLLLGLSLCAHTALAETLPAAVAAAATATPATPATPAAPAAAAPAVAAKPAAKRKAHLRPCPARVPEELNPPADATLELVLPANGVQSYACTVEKPGDKPDWAPKGPHAMLTEGSSVVGIHFGGPSWQGLDGSTVKGTKIASAPGPDKSAVTWLLLSGAPSGEGTFGKITHIQRLETVGGKPPEGGCDASHLDTKVLIPYRANYFFYRLSEPGEKVQQCKGTASEKPKPKLEKPAK